MKNCYDGFEVSLYDLKLRGPGDMLGDQQSGLPTFMIGDVFKDVNILEVYEKRCFRIIKE